MKIGLFTDSFNKEEPSGVYNAIYLLKKGLEEIGNEVFIFSPGTKKQKQKADNRTFYFTSTHFKEYPDFRIAVFPFLSTTDVVKKLDLDLIHIIAVGTMGIAGIKTAETLGIPKIATIPIIPQKLIESTLTNSVKEMVEKLALKYLRWFYNHFETVICPSEYAKRIMEKEVSINITDVIPFGIDYEFFSSRDLNKNKNYLVTGGRLVKEKNIQSIIDSMNSIININPHTKLTIFGDGPYKKYIEERIKANNIEKNVKLTGFLPKSKLKDIYKKSSIFLFPSSSDAQSLSVIESMASGVVPLAKEESCLKEIVDKGVGLTYKDKMDLPKKINELNKIINKDMRERAKQIAKEFSYAKIAEKYSEIYKKVKSKKI